MTSKIIELELSVRGVAGYSHYKRKLPVITRLYVKNTSQEPVFDLTVSVESEPAFLLPFKRKIELIPEESTVEVDTEELSLSPYFLTETETAVTGAVCVKVTSEDKIVCRKSAEISVLPYGCWTAEAEFADLLAGFVKPKNPVVTRTCEKAREVLHKWKLPVFSGYEGCGKNEIRQLAASIFTAVQQYDFKIREEQEENGQYFVRSFSDLVTGGEATFMEVSLLAASCLENFGLHPIIIFSAKRVSCGVWLYDNCFMDSYNADAEQFRKHLSEGVNDISAFDSLCVFRGNNLNYTGAEKMFFDGIDGANSFCYALDVKRCRAGGVRPLPEKVFTENGAELLTEEETDINAAPDDLHSGTVISVKAPVSREKQWERRLLDLSLKNSLLNFRPSVNTLHVIVTDIEETVKALRSASVFKLAEMPPDISGNLAKIKNFDTKGQIRTLAELNEIELKNRRLRCFAEAPRLKTSLGNLYRRERTALEEMGVDPLYLAAGFLKWYERDNSYFPKYAPLVLFPVSLVKKGGGKGYELSVREDGYQVNTTLLEFLKQEFAIDLRGLDNISPDRFDIKDLIASMRNGVIHMHGWDVTEDVHLAVFSFPRFLMWSDIRYHIDNFAANKLVRSLMDNNLRFSAEEMTLGESSPDDVDPSEVLLPIVADASQFAAVKAASDGKSFVLHGPPGTGKSQTITNIIANAVADGKRVLFVAEKMAALSVVKQRLDGIGIGEFCLELHSDKSDKTDVTERLLSTLSLGAASDDLGFEKAAEDVARQRAKLAAPVKALHTVHYLGISLYEAALLYLDNVSAPDVLDIDSTFCDKLTEKSLGEYEETLSELASNAKTCGEAYRSPFNDLSLTVYSEETKNKLIVSTEILGEEIKHVKAYIGHCLSLFGHRVRTLTLRKTRALYELCKMLTDDGNSYKSLFAADAAVLGALSDFASASREYGRRTEMFMRNFRALPELPAAADVCRKAYISANPDRKQSGILKTVYRKLKKLHVGELNEKDISSKTGELIAVYETHGKMAAAGEKISALLGEKKDFEFLEKLNGELEILYKCAEEVFADYDIGVFNGKCAQLYRGGGGALLKQFIKAYDMFDEAQLSFFREFDIHGDYLQLDEDYLDFLAAKCRSLTENADLLEGWCGFCAAREKLRRMGMDFAVQSLIDGTLTSANLLSAFRKKVYGYYIETIAKEDKTLSLFTGGRIEENIERYRQMCETFEKLTRKEIRNRLLKRIPGINTEGSLSLEIVALQKTAKSSIHGYTLRKLFDDIPNLLPRIAPCMLMSPISVSQYITPEADLFDLVVFDEASQMPTAEAVGSIARGKNAVIVGDPKQLPPTSFFSSDYVDEENPDIEDLESILDDCLALGMPQKHLLWHYRSKHESLIAFSNLMYYGNKLNTFPSPDAMESKVSLRYVADGVYDRGETKQNKKEAENLVEEVRRRLSDKALSKSSIGIVTFSTAQQVMVETLLNAMLVRTKLESAAYDREEPVFVKNLENVQGDERDVILFSVGYGPDRHGSLLLNFGPLNQSAGWRRLNVAVSRAREEMIIFSSMTSAMIDLSRTNSKGVTGLKKFLEFADKGKTKLALNIQDLKAERSGIGRYIAKELRAAGYECRYDVGVSDFKIDVAVVDPRNKKKFILAVIADGSDKGGAKDRDILQIQTLKRLGWNVCRIWTVNFYNNAKREIKRIRDTIDKLTGADAARKTAKTADRYIRQYKTANIKAENVSSDYLFDENNAESITARLTSIVEKEEPISKEFLIKRCLNSYGIMRSGVNINARMEQLAAGLDCPSETLDGTVFYRADDDCLDCGFYRSASLVKREPSDISPYEAVAAMCAVLDEKPVMYPGDLIKEASVRLGYGKLNSALADRLAFSLDYGVARSVLIRSVNEKITKA